MGLDGARMYGRRRRSWELRLVVKKDALGEKEKPFAGEYMPFAGNNHRVRKPGALLR